MPQRASAKKRERQNEKRRLKNRAAKSRLRTESKKFLLAVERGDAAQAGQQMSTVTKLLHQAAAKGLIHKNKAARTQTKLQEKLDSVKGAS